MAFKYMRRECMYFPADRTKPKVESVSSAHINKVASEVFTGIQWQEVSTQYARSTCTFPMFCPHKERAIYKTQMTFGW